jgi:hypothetical protein
VSTYDLLIFQNVKPAGEQLVDLSIGQAGLYCTGIQKLAQSFTLFFLTDVGSVADDQQFGTSFMPDLRANVIQDESSLAASFQTAVTDYSNYVYERQSQDIPTDEQLESATLEQWSLVPGRLSITVRITSVAGDSRVYVMPVEVLPQ